jgi:hypothetical protein
VSNGVMKICVVALVLVIGLTARDPFLAGLAVKLTRECQRRRAGCGFALRRVTPQRGAFRCCAIIESSPIRDDAFSRGHRLVFSVILSVCAALRATSSCLIYAEPDLFVFRTLEASSSSISLT